MITAVVSIYTVRNIITNTEQIHRINQQTIETQRREQAKNIAAWIQNPEASQTEQGVDATIALSNASKVPVYNVFVLSVLNNEASEFTDVNRLIQKSAQRNQYGHLSILPPGKHSITIPVSEPLMGGKRPVIFILFTDAQNREWLRNASGTLSQCDYVKSLSKDGITAPYADSELSN